MQLTLESEIRDSAVIIQCRGRITFGPEAEALEQEVERQTKIAGTIVFRTARVVLQMEGIDFVDSSGLGVLVRLSSQLRAAGGGLKLCQMSERVRKVIEITQLGTVFPAYGSESQAIAAFSGAAGIHGAGPERSGIRIVCVDTSRDLLAELKVLLTLAGHEVLTSLYMGEAATLVRTTGPRLLICGPGMKSVPAFADTLESLHRSLADLQILHLPSDFDTTEAGQAGQALLGQVQAIAERAL